MSHTTSPVPVAKLSHVFDVEAFEASLAAPAPAYPLMLSADAIAAVLSRGRIRRELASMTPATAIKKRRTM